MTRVLITGAAGFVGGALIRALRESGLPWEISGVDNFSRPGSELSRTQLRRMGVRLVHADLRCPSDLSGLPVVDWVIDCAANPSVLAGSDGRASSRQVIENNLLGTVNLLEQCREWRSGFILVSTSRVYSIPSLCGLPMTAQDGAFVLDSNQVLPAGVGPLGVTESFSTSAPISLYGATKLASEALALEYGEAFNLPVWLNRCGVLAGAGQFGRPDQGIFSYWIHSHRRRRPLRFIGFQGTGHQVRDCLHPRDLVSLLHRQISVGRDPSKPPIINLGGGMASARSLHQLTDWCDARFGPHPVARDPAGRAFDIPWLILDPSRAAEVWQWTPQTRVEDILEEISRHADENPEWLELSSPD